MSVYVGTRQYPYGRMLLHHMATDGDVKELHLMAYAIGLHYRHFQDKKGRPHYDISKAMKARAIKCGAIEICDKKLITLCFHKKEAEDNLTLEQVLEKLQNKQQP